MEYPDRRNVRDRPAPAFADRSTQDARLRVSPGLTRLAQICGGKLISVEEKDALDEHYVQHPSILLDLNILVRTAWEMFSGDMRNEAVIAAALAEKQGHTDSSLMKVVALNAPRAKAITRTAKVNFTERPIFARTRRQIGLRNSPVRI